MNETMTVFDRRLLRQRRDRAALHTGAAPFLFAEATERLADRLEDMARGFPRTLDLGCRDGLLASVLRGRGGIEFLVACDLSPEMARRAAARDRPVLAADEEALPFAGHAFDLVFSSLALHWVNDLPGALLQIRRCLHPDGLFLGALLGGGTLDELRGVLMQAELDIEGGASPRISPFVDIRDAGNLLQRAGFALPVADTDTLSVAYPDALTLMHDLHRMGESNVLHERRRAPMRRETLLRAAALYGERFGRADGSVPATFQIIYLTAWAPHPDQQRPLAPGSARGRLADALDSPEVSAGEATGPKPRR
jgi:NADH dehydrogenase [ubiquinone] 1 alpha subcomplex assembly factor 5